MSFPEITPVAAHADRGDFRIIDVREEHEFRGPLGFVDGAELVPLASVAGSLEGLSGSRPLLLVCRSGKRSARACEALQKLGIRDVTNLAGGMIAWNLAGLPVVRTRPASLDALLDQVVCWLAQVTGTNRDSARERIGVLLVGAVASGSEPVSAALERVLDALASELGESGAPPDLDLSLDAFRQDLAGL